MAKAAAKFLRIHRAGLIAATMLALLSAPAWAGGGIQASDLPNPEMGAPLTSRAGNPPSAAAACVSQHGIARPNCDPRKPIEDARKAGGDPGGDGA
jgi:hypothetical protein